LAKSLEKFDMNKKLNSQDKMEESQMFSNYMLKKNFTGYHAGLGYVHDLQLFRTYFKALH
jgi:hypothetical protein